VADLEIDGQSEIPLLREIAERLGNNADNRDPKSIAGLLDLVRTIVAGVLSVSKGQQTVTAATIANGGSLSHAIDLGVGRLVGITTPAGLTQTTLSFQASYDGTTWNDVYSDGGIEKTITVGASRRVVLSPADWYGIRHLRIRTGTSASPSTVSADRVFQLITEA
jgi:hypothetical protein